MITELLKLQLKRLSRQKILFLYFVVLILITINNAFQCKGNLTNTGMEYYAGRNFPILCMQSYIDIVGPLFLSFICAILISGERANGMFKQPLLNGVSKKQLIIAKIASLLIVALVCFLFVVLFSNGVGFCFWRKQIFDNASKCFLQMVLLLCTQVILVLLLVFLSLYRNSISSMMCSALIILLINNLFSQFFGKYIALFDFMYYLYAFSEYNGMMLNVNVILLGLGVNFVTGIVLVYGIIRRINHMIM